MKLINLHQLFIPLSVVAIILMVIFRHSPQIQFELLVLAVLFYLISALTHHHLDKSLTVEVLIEYILIAALALIIFQGLLI